MNDTITKDQVIEAYNNAPDFVRAAFNDGKTTQVIVGLQSKFQLHIDQAGTLSKEVGYLLIGLIDQEKFARRLKSSGFSDQAVTEIARELNEKIFMPIRKAEEKGIPVPTIPQPATHFKLENKIPVPRPVPEAPKIISTLPPAPMKGLPPKVFLPRPSTLGEVV
ncbi:MAG: hypothetical protein NTV60_00115, partial [Candidatus Kaiserbacteria bacterium]|nr:hypothetical protein [Candidatus Kaiserbacteria bacterium]